ncbi:MAG TPA: nuclear transport factor 2 family protein [Pyrinomonadaceae bacterium]|nr:nuclear transport factor 2 family protein [Pyrinomonadaceae bacterium]
MRRFALILMFLAAAVAVSAQRQQDFETTTAATEVTAKKYFDSYMKLDWNGVEGLLASDATFEDAAAEIPYGWKKQTGKDNVMKHFRKEYAALTGMNANNLHSYFSGEVAVFEMELEYRVKNAKSEIVTATMPLVTILTVRSGLVIDHKDFGDYRR